MSEAAISVERLSRSYGPRVALEDLSLQVAPGELFGVLGPNGGGKTTLFRILATLIPPGAGRATIAGHDVVRDVSAVRRSLGVVFQNPALDVHLTVRENLRHQGHLFGLAGAALNRRLDELLTLFSLADRARDKVVALSGGLRRRVELARALLVRPKVLLLDEPTVGLDPAIRRDFWAVINRLRAGESLTVMVTTHLLDEADRCDRVALLDAGRLVALDTPAALKSKVGGDVIVVTGDDPERLFAELKARFGEPIQRTGGEVRIERPRGHEFVAGLVEAFPGRIDSVRVARPSLDDAFLQLTGHHVE